jgi:subtilisin
LSGAGCRAAPAVAGACTADTAKATLWGSPGKRGGGDEGFRREFLFDPMKGSQNGSRLPFGWNAQKRRIPEQVASSRARRHPIPEDIMQWIPRSAPRAATWAILRPFVMLLVPALLLGGCRDLNEPLAPEGRASLSGAPHDGIGIIVVLDANFAAGVGVANRERAAEFARGLGLTATHAYGTALFGFAATVPTARVAELRRHPLVAHVEPDREVSLPEPVFEAGGRPAPSGSAQAQAGSASQVMPWGVARTGARESTARGSGVHVYVLDTGIDPAHPDLLANIGEGHTVFTSACRGNPKNCPPPPTWHDEHGHGTHVAGTIGAADNGSGVIGVAPEVTLHAVQVLDRDGRGTWSGFIAGIDWVADQTRTLGVPTVANMSLGGLSENGKVGTCTSAGLTGSSDAMHTALCNARNAGAVFVVSAGNTGGDSGLRAPSGFYDAVISVSATSCRFDADAVVQTCESGSEAFTTWSSWGDRTDSEYPSQGSLPVAIAAPGAQVLSARVGGGHMYASGTSMAAPHVAGGAALVLETLGGSQAANGSAFTAVRAALLGASECTATWHNVSGNPHSERFLNLRGSEAIDECVEPGEPPPAPPVAATALRVTAKSSYTVTLAWDHPNPAAARFEIWQYTNDWAHLTYVDGEAAFTVEGLLPSTTYWYAVRTVTAEQVTAWSNTVGVTTLPDENAPRPVAAFTVDCGNTDTCRFSNRSTGHLDNGSWSWDLGNGATSTSFNPPPATYNNTGVYVVRLTVTDVIGRTDTAEAPISCERRGNRIRCG